MGKKTRVQKVFFAGGQRGIPSEWGLYITDGYACHTFKGLKIVCQLITLGVPFQIITVTIIMDHCGTS